MRITGTKHDLVTVYDSGEFLKMLKLKSRVGPKLTTKTKSQPSSDIYQDNSSIIPNSTVILSDGAKQVSLEYGASKAQRYTLRNRILGIEYCKTKNIPIK